MNKMNSIAVVFDDHLLFADSFAVLLERLEMFNKIHTMDDIHELTKLLAKHKDQAVYIFLDYYLKDSIGLSHIPDIKRLHKYSYIILMSSITSPIAVHHVLSYNPHGFVSKSSGFDTILKCLNTINEGKEYICPIIDNLIHDQLDNDKVPFTIRELDILQYFAKGLSIADTAEKVHLSKHTIVAHRRNMMNKAQVNSITELLAYARKQELI